MPESEAQFLADAVRGAAGARGKLRILGSGSKQFYPASIEGDVLRVAGYSGIVDYDPAELVLTARAGTPLAEIEQVLAAHGQMLAFEPPQFGGGGTLGGCVATGWSGPRRAYAGAVRDFVIGVQIVDGQGERLRFGGRVIKNVAGYDVSRLMVGAHGALGVLLEISLRVLPGKHEITRQLSLDEASAIERVNRWATGGLPLSGSCHHAGILSVRLAGSPAVLDRVGKEIGGEVVHDGRTVLAFDSRSDCAVLREGARVVAGERSADGAAPERRWRATDRVGRSAALDCGGSRRAHVAC